MTGLQGDSVTSLGVRGNGPNDFINMQLKGQSCIDDNDCCLWVNDVSSAMLKRINLTKSIEKSTCVVDKKVKTYPTSVNAFYFNDSSVVQEMMTAGNYELFTCVNGKSVSHESLYLTDVQNPFSYYKSTMRLDLSSSMLVAAMNSFNQINFLNLRTGERTTSCWGEPVNMTDLVDKDSGLEKWVYYIDIELTENQIYALFMDQSQEDAFEKEKNMEIHVFDKVGHPLKVLELDRYACAFCIDNTGSVLYALVDDSQIYRYRL